VIPGALSTLTPVTSPRLSVIRLEFTYEPTAVHSMAIMINEVRDSLQQVANEVTRIEREFEGAVNFTVVPDSRFEVALSRLNVRFRFAETSWPCKFISTHPLQILQHHSR